MPDCPALRYLLACDAVARCNPMLCAPWFVDALHFERADALEALRAELAK